MALEAGGSSPLVHPKSRRHRGGIFRPGGPTDTAHYGAVVVVVVVEDVVVVELVVEDVVDELDVVVDPGRVDEVVVVLVDVVVPVNRPPIDVFADESC